jgi:hypothetical protein
MILYYRVMTKWSGLGDSTELSRMGLSQQTPWRRRLWMADRSTTPHVGGGRRGLRQAMQKMICFDSALRYKLNDKLISRQELL